MILWFLQVQIGAQLKSWSAKSAQSPAPHTFKACLENQGSRAVAHEGMSISSSPGVWGEDVAVDVVDAVAGGLLWWWWRCCLCFTISKYRIAILNYREIDLKCSQEQVSLLCLWVWQHNRALRRKSATQREENIKFTNQRFSLLGPEDMD